MRNLPKDLKALGLKENELAFCERYMELYWELNDSRFPDLESLAHYHGIKVSSMQTRINRYIKGRKALIARNEKVAKYLPPMDKRKRTSQSFMKEIAAARKMVDKAKGLVVTSAQYGAEVNTEVLASLKAYAKRRGFLLVVMPIRYGRVHIYNKQLDEHELTKELSVLLTEDPDVLVLPADRNFPNENLIPFGKHLVLNTMRLNPTLKNPLTGLDASEGTISQIVGSPKMHMSPVAVSSEREGMPKVHKCSGSVTYPDYDEHRAGIKAAEVLCYGGLVVERDKKDHFHIRQLLSDEEGEFFDMDTLYSAGKVKTYSKSVVDALVLGDWHNVLTDPVVRAAVFEEGGQIDVLRPRYVILHDFFDGWSISHHHAKDRVIRQRKHEDGTDRLAWELNAAVVELRWMISKYPNVKFVMVPSNHNEHLDRYLLDGRFEKEPHNYRLGSELFQKVVDNPDKSAFQIFLEDNMTEAELSHIQFLQRDDDFIIHGIDLSLHGDVGPNGARGSVANIDKIGHRSIIGHTHTPHIRDKVWQVGLCARLQLEYNTGPSSWMHTNAIVYKNGQRQLINLIAGKWHVDSPDFRGAEVPDHYRGPFEKKA